MLGVNMLKVGYEFCHVNMMFELMWVFCVRECVGGEKVRMGGGQNCYG